jgi:NDP-sugar pyrophosphorylase family protein
MNVKAVILAGGLGTRLRSAVADRPKVLALVHGRPWVTFLLDQLVRAGIRETILLTGYRAELVQDALGNEYAGMRLVHSPERTPLGTAGALRGALSLLTNRSVLLMNGDSYCAVDFSALCEFHRRREADISMVLARCPDPARFGSVCLETDGRVAGFEEKAQSQTGGLINAGVYAMATSLIEEIPANRQVSLEKEMFPAWVGSKAFYGFQTDGRFLDIGIPESYAQAATFVEMACAEAGQ